MKTNNDRIAKAMKLAEAKFEDKADTKQCIEEMQKFAGLSLEEARLVTSSLRSDVFPQTLREEGFSDEEIRNIITASADFAKENMMPEQDHELPVRSGVPGVVEYKEEADDEGDTESDEDFDFPSKAKDEEEDLTNDESESTENFDTDGDESTELTVVVPKDKLLALQQAIDDVFAEQDLDGFDDLGEDEDSVDEFSNDTTPVMGEEGIEDGEDDGDDYDIEIMDEKPEAKPFAPSNNFKRNIEDSGDDVRDFEDKHVLSNVEVDKMTKEVLAQRRAAREALLAKTKSVRTASDAEQETKGDSLAADPASNTFGKSKAAQIHDKELSFRRDTLDNSQGSEMANEAKWKPAKNEIPTMNKSRLNMDKSYSAVSLEGSPEDSKDYVVDFDVFEVPTEMTDAQYGETPKIPQTEGSGFDSHRGQVLAKAKKKDVDADTEVNIGNDVAAKKDKEKYKKEIKAQYEEAIVAERARLKTAYSCAYKLVEASLIGGDEADGFVDMWLDNNATGKQMKVQTGVMLRSSNAKNTRVAANNNANRVAQSPITTFTGYGALSNPAVLDLRESLAGCFSTPTKEEFEEVLNKRSEEK
jgi:hypothetical protein